MFSHAGTPHYRHPLNKLMLHRISRFSSGKLRRWAAPEENNSSHHYNLSLNSLISLSSRSSLTSRSKSSSKAQTVRKGDMDRTRNPGRMVTIQAQLTKVKVMDQSSPGDPRTVLPSWLERRQKR